MSYWDYLDGRININYVRRGDSFATYSYEYNEILKSRVCYIRDIYVAKEDRLKGVGSEMADHITSHAKADELPYLIGSTDLNDNDVELSMKSLLGYGFKYLNLHVNGYMFWYKEIK